MKFPALPFLMKTLEDFLYPTQPQLFNSLRKRYQGNAFYVKGAFILVRGESPILLVAHLDTVHKSPVEIICASKGGNVLMSPQGIGGDDRCGVYALVKVFESAQVKPWLLFTCDEEIGGVGADTFCTAHAQGKLPAELDALKFIVEIDRRGACDAVYYDCANFDFEDYISGKGFVTAQGSFSDISFIAPELGVAAVNLSSGYYNAHKLHEYIVRSELERTIDAVSEMVSDAAQVDFPVFPYLDAGAFGQLDFINGFEVGDDA